MNVTLESLTEAFRKWNDDASAGKWSPRDNTEENAIAQAEYLLELLENNS